MSLKDDLDRFGFCLLKGVSRTIFLKELKSVGEIFYTTDVVVDLSTRALVTSDKALGFHTDHSKAKYIGWYCVEQCSKGGESLLVDTHRILNELTDEEKFSLMNVNLYEHKIFDDDPKSCPILRFEKGVPLIYYSFWLANDKDKKNSAFCRFRELVESDVQIRLRLEPSDSLIIDNRRMLHARTAIMGDKKRFLKRFWLR